MDEPVTRWNNDKFTKDLLDRCVTRKYSIIVKGFDPSPTHVMGKLLERSIISLDILKQISDMPKEKRSSELVNMLLETSHPTAMKTFLEILQEEPAIEHLSDAVYEIVMEEVGKRGERNRVTNSLNSASTTGIAFLEDTTKNQVQQWYTELIQIMDPHPVLDELFGKKVITLEQLQDISSLTNIEDCCRQLLQELFRIEVLAAFDTFKDILHEKQPWVWNTIWMNPVDEVNRCLTPHERNKLKANFFCFKKLLKPYENDFIDHLLSNDCLTWGQYNTITSPALTRNQMISKLFETLMRRSYDHFQKFIQSLRITYQENMSKILESNGIGLPVHVDLKQSGMEKYLSEIITKTAHIDDLDLEPGVRETLENILKKFEEKGIFIVGASAGSLIIYMLCLTLDSVNELENMFHTGQLKTYLNILLPCIVGCENSFDVDINIDHKDFRNARKFFNFEINQKRQIFHYFVGGKLNNMPSILLEIILIRASEILWICLLIESLQSNSIGKYLIHGVDGYWSFVKSVSSQIYLQLLSNVCSGWCQLVKIRKYMKHKLLSQIIKTTIQKSFLIITENLHCQDGLLNAALEHNVITPDEKIACDSMADSNRQILKILTLKQFKFFLKFLHLLENGHQHDLANHIISFGVWWPFFSDIWPLDKKKKLFITANGDDLIRSMDMDKFVHPDKEVLKWTQPTPVIEVEEKTLRVGKEFKSHNLLAFLLEGGCITAEQREWFQKLETESAKKQKLFKLLKTGSIKMLEIVMDYFVRTGQHDVVHMLQPNQGVQRYGKQIVNCVDKATEIIKLMIEKKKITPPLMDYLTSKVHLCEAGKLNRFEQNRIVLNILECSNSDVYIFFLNTLLTMNQLLFPMFQNITYSALSENVETYLVESINASSEFLSKLYKLNIINREQLQSIESKRTSVERNKTLLHVIAKTSPKSFNIFLTSLVETDESNILAKIKRLYAKPDEKMEKETFPEAQSLELYVLEYILKNCEPDVMKIIPSERAIGSEVISYHINDEEIPENFKTQFVLPLKRIKLELKIPSDVILLSRLASHVEKMQTSLPSELQNILCLKKVAIGKLSPMNVTSLSRHLSSLLEYMSRNASNILNRDVQHHVLSSYNPAMENISLGINPEELARMSEVKNESSLKSKVKFLCQLLAKSIYPSRYILETLVEKDVLTLPQMSDVEAMTRSEIRVNKLLSILFQSIFRESLLRNHSKIVQMIDGTKLQPDKEPDESEIDQMTDDQELPPYDDYEAEIEHEGTSYNWACRYHPGSPVFHDALKGLSCCKKRSTDFTEFFNIPGCTLGLHSNEKPTDSEKPASTEDRNGESAPPVQEMIIKPVQPTQRSSEDEPMKRLELIVSDSLKQALEKQMKDMSLQEAGQDVDLKLISKGTSCKNNGCTATYVDEGSNEETCICHSGVPVFHEGMKYWSCCQHKTTDFNAFLSQEGCVSTRHMWIKKDDGEKKVACRYDWHQTGSLVTISVYAKVALPTKTYVEANKVTAKINIVFEGGKSRFQKFFVLRGVVDPEKSSVKMLGTKVEIIFKKLEPGSWSSLELINKQVQNDEKNGDS